VTTRAACWVPSPAGIMRGRNNRPRHGRSPSGRSASGSGRFTHRVAASTARRTSTQRCATKASAARANGSRQPLPTFSGWPTSRTSPHGRASSPWRWCLMRAVGASSARRWPRASSPRSRATCAPDTPSLHGTRRGWWCSTTMQYSETREGGYPCSGNWVVSGGGALIHPRDSSSSAPNRPSVICLSARSSG